MTSGFTSCLSIPAQGCQPVGLYTKLTRYILLWQLAILSRHSDFVLRFKDVVWDNCDVDWVICRVGGRP
jgi:hypothetical protein